MALSDLHIAKEYRNLKCDVINDFYVPILSNAVMYKRAVGFFNSAALYEMAIGLRHLVEKQGKMELIVSPRLTEEDIQSINLGYKTREEVIERALLRDFDEPKNKTEFRKLNLLANLIAEGILDIKVAFKINANSAGIFHEKIGIVIDAEGNKVAFTGSMNETYSGLLQNYESIDVFCSWRDEDYDRVNIKENAFDNLWDNLDTAMEVIPFPKVAVERLNSYKVEKTEPLCVEIQNEDDSQDVFFKIPDNVDLYDYQREAIESWKNNNYCGIFDMATGAGKTFTALGALSALSKNLNNHIAVVIVAPYQHLVEQWVEDIIQFNVKPIVAYSYPGQKWRKQFSDAVTAYNVGAIDNFCVIATNATFSLNDFQSILDCITANDENAKNFISDFEELYKRIQKNKCKIAALETEDKEVLAEISAIGKVSTVDAEENLSRYKRMISELREELSKKISEKTRRESERETAENNFNMYRSKSEKAKEYQLYYKYAQAMYYWVNKQYSEKEAQMRDRLNKYVTELFDNIYSGNRDIYIDDKYNINITVNGEIVDDTGGLRVIQYFAYVGGLVKLAYEVMQERTDEEGNAQELGEQYPLVLDAAFSHADQTHTQNIARELANATSQLIFAVMEKDPFFAKQTYNH